MKMLSIFFLLTPAVLCHPYSNGYGLGYSKTAVLTIKGLPTNLVYNPNNYELHFTLIDVESLENDEIQTRMDQYILRDNYTIKITNINGQAAAVDPQNDRVYLASDNGLYTLNSSNEAQFFTNKGDDIVQLFKPDAGNNLYAVMYPENDIYVIDVVKNEKRKVNNVPCASILAVDDEENMYYVCEPRDVKVLLKGFQEPIQIAGIPRNNARAITIDNYSRVILAANDGLYALQPNNVIPTKLMDLDYVPVGLAFDGEDFYISTNGAIYKYTKRDYSESDTSQNEV